MAEDRWASRSDMQRDSLFSLPLEPRNDKLMTSSVTFSPSLEEHFNSRESNAFLHESFELRSSPLSKSSGYISRKNHESRLSARCYPYTGHRSVSRLHSNSEDSDSDNYLSLDDLTETTGYLPRQVYRALPKQRDFIRRLPVQLSKYILSFLDATSLSNSICVSNHWRSLVEEVQNETLMQQIMREDIMLIQVNANLF